MSEALEQQLAPIIAEHVTIGYVLRPDGLVDPDTIRITGALGTSHMVIHFIKQHMTGKLIVRKTKIKQRLERVKRLDVIGKIG